MQSEEIILTSLLFNNTTSEYMNRGGEGRYLFGMLVRQEWMGLQKPHTL